MTGLPFLVRRLAAGARSPALARRPGSARRRARRSGSAGVAPPGGPRSGAGAARVGLPLAGFAASAVAAAGVGARGRGAAGLGAGLARARPGGGSAGAGPAAPAAAPRPGGARSAAVPRPRVRRHRPRAADGVGRGGPQLLLGRPGRVRGPPARAMSMTGPTVRSGRAGRPSTRSLACSSSAVTVPPCAPGWNVQCARLSERPARQDSATTHLPSSPFQESHSASAYSWPRRPKVCATTSPSIRVSGPSARIGWARWATSAVRERSSSTG